MLHILHISSNKKIKKLIKNLIQVISSLVITPITKMGVSGYVYINPHTFENCIFVFNTLSVHTNIFQRFLIHNEMLENVKFVLLHMRKSSKNCTEMI